MPRGKQDLTDLALLHRLLPKQESWTTAQLKALVRKHHVSLSTALHTAKALGLFTRTYGGDQVRQNSAKVKVRRRLARFAPTAK